MSVSYQSPSAARGLRYRKWPFGMASEVFWRSGEGAGVGGFGGPPFEEATTTPGTGVGGFGGHPSFEEATSTPGAGVGGFGGSPPI